MAHWQHSQSDCRMPSTKTTQTHRFHLSMLTAIQLVNFLWRSYMLVQCYVSYMLAADPSASIRPHAQHKLHVACSVKFNGNVCTRTCSHLICTYTCGGALQWELQYWWPLRFRLTLTDFRVSYSCSLGTGMYITPLQNSLKYLLQRSALSSQLLLYKRERSYLLSILSSPKLIVGFSTALF